MNELTPEYVDIAIVGAGLVGAALAASLNATGLNIAIIDHQSAEELCKPLEPASSVHAFEPRVSALTNVSQGLLSAVGAWAGIAPEQIQYYQHMFVWDELGTASISFDSAEMYQDSLGCIVENQLIVSALHQGLKKQANLKRFFETKVSAIQQVAASKNEHLLQLNSGVSIQCKLLVAADGAQSKVRQWAFMPTREWDYQHEAIVATVKTSAKHQNTAWQRFSETGPLAFLPLADKDGSQQYCSIVWSQESSKAKQLMALSDEAFLIYLQHAIESKLGRLESVSKRHAIPLRQRHAKHYVKPGIALLGDAAHTIHPLAGQGVNLGFKDVIALSEVLKEADSNAIAVNDFVLLKRYQRNRQGDNLLMMGAMEGFKRLFEQPDPVIRWLRNAGMSWVNKQGFLKNQIARHAMGLSS